jgi:hypothetical protein
MDDALKKLRERCKRTVLRKIETGEITYDRNRKHFIYKDTEDEYKLDQRDDDDDDDEGSSDGDYPDDEDEDSDGDRPKVTGDKIGDKKTIPVESEMVSEL